MRVLPLFYIETFSDEEIAEHECSDRIWCSPSQFRQWTDDAEPGVTTLLHLTNEEAQSRVGCIYGVHHFNDPELLYVPNWMYIELGEGSIIIESAQPGLCTNLVLQPHTSEHLSADDPQELLRDAFERYSCLTPGTTIPLWIGKPIVVTIAELGPVSNSTLCIRNCELSLELLRPLDMPEEVRAEKAEKAEEAVKAEEAEKAEKAEKAVKAEKAEEAVKAEEVKEEVAEAADAVNTIIDARPRHVIMAEVARRRMMALQADATKN